MTEKTDHIAAAHQALAGSAELLRAATCAQNKAAAALHEALETPVQNTLHSRVAPSDHRRHHRPGRPPKIDADPRLQAFIRARIDQLTFMQIAEAVASAFPPERRVGKSAIHAWWSRNRRSLASSGK